MTSSLVSRQPSDFTPAWPAAGLDVNALLDDGWRPEPFRQFVLKLNGRCNLACRYCYVYEMADTSWRDKPRVVSTRTLDQIAIRIAEHAAAHRLAEVEIVLHGGEPLLCGTTFVENVVTTIRAGLSPETRLSVRLQTNGTLLTEETLGMLLCHDVKVGVSLDGTIGTHDARRVHADGRGSHSEVAAALRKLATARYAPVFSGILATIDVAADPVETYEALAEFAPPRVDFLLPHANWEYPPAAGHGPWLAAVFDRWYTGAETRVRLFEEIIGLLLGGHSRTEMIGLSPVGLVVVDTDGSIEQVDTLKSAFPGAPETGMNVFGNSFDDALMLPEFVARQIGTRALSNECLACPVHKVCGGGYFPHRYRPGSGFKNASAYCGDLGYLIAHIARRIRMDLAERRACLPGTRSPRGTLTRSATVSAPRPPWPCSARPS